MPNKRFIKLTNEYASHEIRHFWKHLSGQEIHTRRAFAFYPGQAPRRSLYLREFYQFLTDDLKLQIRQAGVFEGNDFEADMVLSIGGDGTFLKAASRVGSRNIPILGINTGRLGFLADVSPEEMEDTFNDIYSNNYRIEDRSVLQVSCKEQELKGYPFGLNEIAVLKRDSSSNDFHSYSHQWCLSHHLSGGWPCHCHPYRFDRIFTKHRRSGYCSA